MPWPICGEDIVHFNDAVTGAIILAFAVVAVAIAQTFSPVPGEPIGPNLFPSLIGIGLGLCAVILIISGIRERRATGFLVQFDPWVRDGNALFTVALVPVGVIFYVLAVDTLGFILCSFIILATLLYRLRRRFLSSVVIAAVATAIIQVIFGNILLVPLSLGLLEPIIYR